MRRCILYDVVVPDKTAQQPQAAGTGGIATVPAYPAAVPPCTHFRDSPRFTVPGQRPDISMFRPTTQRNCSAGSPFRRCALGSASRMLRCRANVPILCVRACVCGTSTHEGVLQKSGFSPLMHHSGAMGKGVRVCHAVFLMICEKIFSTCQICLIVAL